VIGEQRRAEILAAARRLLDEEGVEAITMRRLGALVGIRGPSLYKHLSSRDQIHTALAIEALTDLADILEPVLRTFTDLAAAYTAAARAYTSAQAIATR
jgi:AcrR family transcriptional regulator